MEDQYLSSGSTRVRLRFLAANAVRITHLPPGSESDPLERPWLPYVIPPTPLTKGGEEGIPTHLMNGGEGGIPTHLMNGGEGGIPTHLMNGGEGGIPTHLMNGGEEGIPTHLMNGGEGGIPTHLMNGGEEGVPTPLMKGGEGGIPTHLMNEGEGGIPTHLMNGGEEGIPTPLMKGGEGGIPPTQSQPDALRVELHEGCIRVRTHDGQTVLSEARPAQQDATGRVYLALRIAADEGFYGWGEWFNAFRRDKGTVRLWSRESPAVVQSRQTYSNIPFFLSSRGYGFLLLNSHESIWHILPERGVLQIGAAGPPADYVVIYGPAFRDILTTYTALTGRPPLVPLWAFGLWVTEYPQENQEQALKLVEEHRQRNIPLDAVILDYHWEERFHNFHWRPSLFPAPDKLLAQLRELGVRLGLIFTPFVNNRNVGLQKWLLNMLFHNVPAGREKDDERAMPQYEEAKSKGYLAHPQARWWFGSGGMVDFTNQEAANWWNAMLRPLYDQGVAFFKNDDGEYLPNGAHSALGLDAREYHNLYGFFYGKAIYEGMAKLDERRPLIYARSVWAGSQRYPAIFLGDQKPTFDHIRATMRAGLNMSLAGFAYWTADVFGLDGKTTPETHMRYAQWALLVPIARYFWRPPQVDDTRFPWSHGPQVEANFRQYTELRYRLLPYYYALAWEAHRTGLPILRPLVLEFQHDPHVVAIADQVMLGDRLMLAPVVQPGATSRTIYLPTGRWHDFWSVQSFDGGREIEYAAPLDRLPILVRGGTVLPLGPVLQHIPDDHRFDPVQFHIWPPYPAEGALYEDDGATRVYQGGAWSVLRVTAQEQGNTLEVRIAAAQGEFPEQLKSRSIELVLHRAAIPMQVRIQGRENCAWDYASTERRLHISLQCPVHQETIVEVIRAPESVQSAPRIR